MIVPDGVLFGSSNAHKKLRQTLVEDQKLDAVVKLPGGVFKPYAGVSTAILLFTKTSSGGTDCMWFYDVEADGWSLDDKRAPNNLPDALTRWAERNTTERGRPRTSQRFCVPKVDSAANGYDLSLGSAVGCRTCLAKPRSEASSPSCEHLTTQWIPVTCSAGSPPRAFRKPFAASGSRRTSPSPLSACPRPSWIEIDSPRMTY